MKLHKQLQFLVTISLAAVAFSEAISENNSTVEGLDLFRLKNALHPYRKEIRATWTRRTTITQEDSQGPLSCNVCRAVMPLLRQWLDTGRYTHEEIQDLVISGCKSLGLAPRPEICDPIIKIYTGQFLYIIANTKDADNGTDPSNQICGIVTPDCDHPNLDDWKVNLAGNKPALGVREILDATAASVTKIIQFTDLHVDLDYVEGTNTDCGEGMPICCREYEGIPENQSLRAGLYGDFHCALPFPTLKIMLNHAKDNNPDARYVFLTGDYIHSGVWLYNKEENGRHVRNVTQALVEVFPNKDNVTIYPLVGNHEPHVVNMYPPEELWGEEDFSIAWLYNDVMKPFRDRDPSFLPEEEFKRFSKGGFYSVSPEPGLKIIVMNTNLCSPENFWLGYNPYPIVKDQLQWLADVLKSAEDAKESVLIVGHIEPGNCWPLWSGKFNEVVERFEGIIRGSFFGHSHKPQYRISMAKGTTKPVFSSYIAGSALPDSMHPTYSIFHVDGERGRESKWDVLRQELIVLDLLESNSLRTPVFKKLADSLESFGMPNLSPSAIWEFANSLLCNQELVDNYLIFHSKGNDTLSHRTCSVTDATCMTDILCNIVSSNAADQSACKYFERKIQDEKCEVSSGVQNTVSIGVFMLAVFHYFLKNKL